MRKGTLWMFGHIIVAAILMFVCFKAANHYELVNNSNMQIRFEGMAFILMLICYVIWSFPYVRVGMKAEAYEDCKQRRMYTYIS